MYRDGHFGVALALSVPIVGVLIAAGHSKVAGLVFAVVFASEPLPDLDSTAYVSLPHRGPFHSIVFAAGVGFLASVVGFVFGTLFGTFAPIIGVIVGSLSAFYGVCTHLVADVINPLGIRPFWPVSDRCYRIPEPDGVCKADNPIANVLFLFGGILLTLIVAMAVVLVSLL
jgi:inner membrane protein